MFVAKANVWWATIMQHPDKMKKAQAEIDAVVSKGGITLESLKKLEYVQNYKFLQEIFSCLRLVRF